VLPAVAALPATAALPIVPALPATATLAKVPALPATAPLRAVAALPATLSTGSSTGAKLTAPAARVEPPMPLAVTGYEISLWIHITAAMLGFGATFAEPGL
jgi:hypothetical protein